MSVSTGGVLQYCAPASTASKASLRLWKQQAREIGEYFALDYEDPRLSLVGQQAQRKGASSSSSATSAAPFAASSAVAASSSAVATPEAVTDECTESCVSVATAKAAGKRKGEYSEQLSIKTLALECGREVAMVLASSAEVQSCYQRALEELRAAVLASGTSSTANTTSSTASSSNGPTSIFSVPTLRLIARRYSDELNQIHDYESTGGNSSDNGHSNAALSSTDKQLQAYGSLHKYVYG